VDRLRDHETVVVTLPTPGKSARSSFTAKVLAVADATVALQTDVKVDAIYVPDRTTNVFITFRHENALVGFRGTLFAAEPLGDFRFVVSDRDVTRRRATRVALDTTIGIRRVLDDSPGEEVEARTVNIAPGGLLLDAPTLGALLGDTVEFRLPFPGRPDVVLTGQGTVVREGDGLVALALAATSTEARAGLGALVIERSRALLHREDAVEPTDVPGF
jgi:PilZ domain-containing protein